MTEWYVIILLVVWACLLVWTVIASNLVASLLTVFPYCGVLFLTKEFILLPYYQFISDLIPLCAWLNTSIPYFQLCSAVFQTYLFTGICMTISIVILMIIISNILLFIAMMPCWFYLIYDFIKGKMKLSNC